jgi:hypothetical protein
MSELDFNMQQNSKSLYNYLMRSYKIIHKNKSRYFKIFRILLVEEDIICMQYSVCEF